MMENIGTSMAQLSPEQSATLSSKGFPPLTLLKELRETQQNHAVSQTVWFESWFLCWTVTYPWSPVGSSLLSCWGDEMS